MPLLSKRTYGTGHLEVRRGKWYGQWRGPDGKQVHRVIGSLDLSEAEADVLLQHKIAAQRNCPVCGRHAA